MKILVISLDFPFNPGGIAVFLHNLCLQLSDRGHFVDVLTPFREGCAEVDSRQPYHIYRYPIIHRISSFAPLWKTIRLYRRNFYDLVFIGHFMTTHALGALVLHKLWGTPFAILCHGNDLYYSLTNWIDKLIAYYVLRRASVILCNSHATAQRVRNKGYKGPIQILHPGVDLGKFRPDLETLAVRQKYHLDGRKVLLSVSRLVKRKGHDRVLHALPEVIKRVPNVLYLIAGSGEEEVYLRNMVEKMGLAGHVVSTGYVEQALLPSLYCASDLFIMPSFSREHDNDYEGFGIVFSEASACGIPVIGGRSGGIEDAVIDGETGLLVDPHNVDEILTAIIRVLTDRALARRLGENGRRRVERELSWEKVGRRLESYLRALIEHKAHT